MQISSIKKCLSNHSILLFILLLGLKTSQISAQENLNDLIKKVQKNSQKLYDNIETVKFEGYAKTYVYFSYKPFDVKLIPLIKYYYFDGLWIKPDSIRIVIKALRETESESSEFKVGDPSKLPSPFQFIYDPNIFGMSIKSGDKKTKFPLYPFTLGASSFYKYKKDYEIGFGENKIWGIKIIPKDETVPGVIGTFQIDPDRYVVAGSNIIFNKAASYTETNLKRTKNSLYLSMGGIENKRIKTKYALFHSSYWLPQTIEEEFEFGTLGANFKVFETYEFKSYSINPEKPDTTFKINNKLVIKRDSTFERKMFGDKIQADNSLKKEQKQILNNLERRFTSPEFYNFLFESKTISDETAALKLGQYPGRYLQLTKRLSDFMTYNRVEGLRLNYGINFTNPIFNNSIFSINNSYGFKDKRWKGEAALLQFVGRKKQFFLESNLFNTLAYEEEQKLITPGKNTVTSLLYKGDYLDYYYKIGGKVEIGYQPINNAAFKLSFVYQKEKQSKDHTNFSIFKPNKRFRFNPQILEGNFRGLNLKFGYQTLNFNSNITAEYTDKNVFKSDFSFSSFKANIWKRYNLTNSSDLNFNLSTGFSNGSLPPQRWFDFGGKTFLNFYGNLRSIDYKTFTGDQMFNSTFEYVLKGGMFFKPGSGDNIIKKLKLTLWTGIGWSSLSDKSRNLAANLLTPTLTTNGIYHEIGIGIGDLLNIFRIDVVRNRISKNKLLVSFNMLR